MLARCRLVPRSSKYSSSLTVAYSTPVRQREPSVPAWARRVKWRHSSPRSRSTSTSLSSVHAPRGFSHLSSLCSCTPRLVMSRGTNVASSSGRMFQYQGSSSSKPVESLRASAGARKPVLRLVPTGKLNAGSASTGTPLKRSAMPRAVPIPASVSSRIESARTYQSSASGGQVE